MPRLGDTLVIEVEATVTPRSVRYHQDRHYVPSPALIPIPVGQTERQIFTLWILGLLVQEALKEANQTTPFTFKAQLIEYVFYDWQVRRYSDLLSDWHTYVMGVIYDHDIRGDAYETLVQQFDNLCAKHRFAASAHILHVASGLGLTYICVVPQLYPLVLYPLVQLSQHGPPDRLLQLAVDKSDQHSMEAKFTGNWIHDLALASIFDYVVDIYGPEQIPRLMDGFRYYDTWEDLVTEVFNMTVADFEAGWQSYLVQRYGSSVRK